MDIKSNLIEVFSLTQTHDCVNHDCHIEKQFPHLLPTPFLQHTSFPHLLPTSFIQHTSFPHLLPTSFLQHKSFPHMLPFLSFANSLYRTKHLIKYLCRSYTSIIPNCETKEGYYQFYIIRKGNNGAS